jgi:hypothetical protein
MTSRRAFVVRLTGLLVGGLSARRLAGQAPLIRVGPTPITIYKSSTCGCCTKWVDHVRANDFAASVYDEEDMDRLKDKLGVPTEVRSCHTARIEGYLIEGHVPASDIRRLLAEKPEVAGLAVPGMPSRTPGMAGPGEKIGGFEVVAFQRDGATRRFSRY